MAKKMNRKLKYYKKTYEHDRVRDLSKFESCDDYYKIMKRRRSRNVLG